MIMERPMMMKIVTMMNKTGEFMEIVLAMMSCTI